MINVPYNKYDLRNLIRETLQDFSHWSTESEELVIGTIAHESLCGLYRRQKGRGPARGIAQMEPATEIDCWGNYLAYHPEMSSSIRRISGVLGPNVNALENNDKYSILMCRVKYLRSSLALPAADDLPAQAEYWLKIYNGTNDISKIAAYIADYNRLIKE